MRKAAHRRRHNGQILCAAAERAERAAESTTDEDPSPQDETKRQRERRFLKMLRASGYSDRGSALRRLRQSTDVTAVLDAEAEIEAADAALAADLADAADDQSETSDEEAPDDEGAQEARGARPRPRRVPGVRLLPRVRPKQRDERTLTDKLAMNVHHRHGGCKQMDTLLQAAGITRRKPTFQKRQAEEMCKACQFSRPPPRHAKVETRMAVDFNERLQMDCFFIAALKGRAKGRKTGVLHIVDCATRLSMLVVMKNLKMDTVAHAFEQY